MPTSEEAKPLPLTGWRGLVLVTRFLTELVLFAALAYVGAVLPDQLLLKITFAVTAPAAAIVVWGMYIGPRARHRLLEPWRFLTEVALFAAAGATMTAAGHPVIGIFLVSVAGIGVAALTRVAAPGG